MLADSRTSHNHPQQAHSHSHSPSHSPYTWSDDPSLTRTRSQEFTSLVWVASSSGDVQRFKGQRSFRRHHESPCSQMVTPGPEWWRDTTALTTQKGVRVCVRVDGYIYVCVLVLIYAPRNLKKIEKMAWWVWIFFVFLIYRVQVTIFFRIFVFLGINLLIEYKLLFLFFFGGEEFFGIRFLIQRVPVEINNVTIFIFFYINYASIYSLLLILVLSTVTE